MSERICDVLKRNRQICTAYSNRNSQTLFAAGRDFADETVISGALLWKTCEAGDRKRH
jgi:hypothetical protein